MRLWPQWLLWAPLEPRMPGCLEGQWAYCPVIVASLRCAETGRDVAIKVINLENVEDTLEVVAREVEALTRVR